MAMAYWASLDGVLWFGYIEHILPGEHGDHTEVRRDLQNSCCAMAALSFMKLICQVATNKCVKWIFNGVEKHTTSVLITDKDIVWAHIYAYTYTQLYDILGCRTIPREANQSVLNKF